jgi:putative (di)nucleoside polyphosphate hydrolase
VNFWDNVQLELIKTGLAIVTLGIGWLIGQRIIKFWDTKKKRQELDIATSREFHKLYGEFKEVSRIWRTVTYEGPRDQELKFPAGTRLELLKRSSASEGGIEAIIVKLATERDLTDAEIKNLGLFRQAFQELRAAIRAGRRFNWDNGTPDYVLYNDLAAKVARIIYTETGFWSREPSLPPSKDVHLTLRNITAITAADWQAERCKEFVDKRSRGTKLPDQYFRASAGAVVVNSEGLVLSLERADISHAWQFPQGGLETAEEPSDAAVREVMEETAIKPADLELLDKYPEVLCYEVPAAARSSKTGRGQVQYWFLFRFRGSEDKIDVIKGGEFRSWKWNHFDDALAAAVEFRKPIYLKLGEHFKQYLAAPKS